MPENLNFILGSGERLMEPIPAPGRFVPKRVAPYSPGYARERLLQPLDEALTALAATPIEATVDGDAIVAVTLHPQFLAKTSYPGALMEAAGLRNVGSRRTIVEPERWTTREPRGRTPTTQLFAATQFDSLARWREAIARLPEMARELQQLTRVEALSVPAPGSRVRLSDHDLAADDVAVEVVLHEGDRARVLGAFERWARTVGAEVDLERRIVVGDLAFLPARARTNVVPELARFAFTRVVRSMPRLRGIRPTVVTRSGPTRRVRLPDEGPLDSDLRVAVFDGGLLPDGPLAPWTTSFDASGVAGADDDGLIHGHRVTSALLFGSLPRAGAAPRPYAHVDHYRVLDDRSGQDPEDLFDVLPRILGVLSTRPYEFVSLSIGPHLPVEDDDPHAWTVALDDHLSSGTTLLAVAVGNDGEQDRPSGNARIQPPADCVNALAVGAADSAGAPWFRASYSCVGPGRSPGLVKPDVLGYGGCVARPFEVLDHDSRGRTVGTFGTSFAAPAAMRLAVGIRALLGNRLTAQGVRALLIHGSEEHADGREDVGWGRLPPSLEELVVCGPGSVRVLYQGTLDPAGYVRMPVPLPPQQLSGMVTITATIVYAAPVDASHSDAYTKAGVEVTFRPHSERFADEDGSTVPKSRPFFQLRHFSDEGELRRDAHKWETVLHRSDRLRGTSLQAPVFDLHYNAREAGHGGRSFPRVPYAAVLSVEAPKEPDLYNAVLRSYAGQLQALTPVLDIPLQIDL
jgi:hypothetical protein